MHPVSASVDAYLPAIVRDWAATDPATTHRIVRGSLVVLDISGFTRLTERLADRGRAGAEELSDILHEVFVPMVGEALDEGCDLLKWGGDAVLLLAGEPSSAARAVRAATRMRATLARIGHLETTVGRVVLRASTGVATGDVHLALVGDPEVHRELIVLGPVATAVTALEAAAAAGQVVVDPTTAAQLPTRWTGEPIGPGVLLTATAPAIHRLPVAPAARPALPRAVDLTGYLPAQLRVHLDRGTHEPEHRVAAAAFVRFTGTDALALTEGQARLAGAVDALVRNVQDATTRHGAAFHETDIDLDGGKIMLVAGAPQSSGDDVDHLLAAVRLVVDRAGSLPLRAGVAQGRVFAGDLGPVDRRTYSVKGAAVNLAARLAGRAAPGQVTVPADLLGHSRTSWEISSRAALRLKGIRQPVPVVALGRALSGQVTSPPATVMVGRDDEMATMRRALDRLGQGTGSVVTVVGEPGLGKTRFAAEVLAEADDFGVLRAECGHSGASRPYGTVRTLLAAALGMSAGTDPQGALGLATTVVARAAPGLVDQLGLLAMVFDVELPAAARSGSALDEEFRSEALRRLVVEVFRACLTAPTVILVEDAHLMDGDSVRVLEELVLHATGRPWLVLATRRDSAQGWLPGGEVLTLRPLADAAAEAMTELVVPDRALTPATARSLVARAGGHPLFLRELVLAATRGEQLDDLPQSVEELVAVQVDALAARPRALLRRAAVLGLAFSQSMLDEVAADLVAPGDPPVRAQLAQLDAFLVPDGPRRWRFRHAVHRETAYAGLPMKVRARLHGQVAAMLSRSAATTARRPELLAHHFLAAGDYDRAWESARRAGQKAAAQAAPEAAAHAYSQAVAAGGRSVTLTAVERAADLECWGDSLFLCGRSTEADHAYAQARTLWTDAPVSAAAIALKSAKVAQRQGRYAMALRRTTTGLRLLDGVDGTEALAGRARVLARRSVIRMSQGRYGEAAACARRAVVVAEEAREDDARAQAHLVLHGVEVFTGASSEEDHGRTALELYERLGDVTGQAHAHNNIAMRLLLMGEWTQALQRFQRAAAGFEEVGDVANSANAAYNSADLLNRQGRGAEALALLTGVLRIARAVDDEELYALALREQGRAHARSGDAPRAQPLLARSRALFEALHEPHEVCDTDIATAEAWLLDGEPLRALHEVDEALVAAGRLGARTLLPSALRVRASALVVLGDSTGAQLTLDRGLAASAEPELAHERGFLLAVAAHLAATTGPVTQAQVRAREAAVALAALGVVRAPVPWAGPGEDRTSPGTGRGGGDVASGHG